MRLASLTLFLVALAPAGCVINWGDDPDPPCLDPLPGGGLEADEAFIPDPGLVNPETLQCESFGYNCDSRCGPCPATDVGAGADIAVPSWGSCASECRNLGELACAGTAGCRTTYDHNCLIGGGPCTAEVAFMGCQPVDTSGPIQGACEGLNAWECSRHDDCLATYREGPAGRLFAACLPELVFNCREADCG